MGNTWAHRQQQAAAVQIQVLLPSPNVCRRSARCWTNYARRRLEAFCRRGVWADRRLKTWCLVKPEDTEEGRHGGVHEERTLRRLGHDPKNHGYRPMNYIFGDNQRQQIFSLDARPTFVVLLRRAERERQSDLSLPRRRTPPCVQHTPAVFFGSVERRGCTDTISPKTVNRSNQTDTIRMFG